MPLFPFATIYFTPLVYTMAALAVVYTSLTAIRQTDLKRIIAYTSVAHMNLVVIGMFSLNTQGIEGSILQMLSHGLVSSALFLCIGVVYDRHHTRLVKYYSGLSHTMPLYIVIFLIFTMANIALPGTSSFVGEFLIFVGAFQSNTTITFLGATGMVLGGGYSLWLYNRIAFGNLKIQYINEFVDINRREFFIFLPLVIGTIFMGIYPEVFLDPMHVSVKNLIEQIVGSV
jgi:proton-translocating NADH-quinone oxidoreductase chain M